MNNPLSNNPSDGTYFQEPDFLGGWGNSVGVRSAMMGNMKPKLTLGEYEDVMVRMLRYYLIEKG